MGNEPIECSVIAPMYNEEPNVERTLLKVTTELDKLHKTYEIIFVNDGSTDNTLQVCERAKSAFHQLKVISYTPNQGRGKALREGFGAARGKYVFVIDFDLSYDEGHITRMYKAFLSNPMTDIVLVSAYMKGGKVVGVPMFRLFMSRLGNFLLSFTFSQKVRTSTCIVRGYRRDVIKSMSLDSDGKEIHLEILSKAFMLGCKVQEIPGTLQKRKIGESKFRFKNTSKSHLLFIFMERPAYYFFILGTIFFLLSFVSGTIVIFNRLFHDIPKGIIANNVSPALVIFLFVFSAFSFVFSLIGKLFGNLRKEILKVQSLLIKRDKGE